MNPLLIRAFGIVGALLFAGAIGWHTGAKIERANWQAEKIKMQQASEQALQEQVLKNETILKDQQEKSYKASADYEQAINDLRGKYVNATGLRISAAVCNQAAGTTAPASASRLNETSPATVQLPPRVEEGLLTMTRRADELAEQLRALQEWIIAQGFYPGGMP